MRPRDYFEKHVWMGGSLMKRYEAEMRHEIGIDKLMWGADYPHLEGAAPVHRETLRYIFGGMPEDDIRRMLGANACDLWGFDGDMLQSVADRVGPTVADLATPLALADIEDTFSWSLARPVPLLAGGADRRSTSTSTAPQRTAPHRTALHRVASHAHRTHWRTSLSHGERRSHCRRSIPGERSCRRPPNVPVNSCSDSCGFDVYTTPCLHRRHGVGELRRSTRGTGRLWCATNYGDGESMEKLHHIETRFDSFVTEATAAFEAGEQWAADGAKTAASWISTRCRVPRAAAKRRVRLGRTLRHLPAVAEAWRDGAIGEDQARAIASARRHRTEASMARDEEMLVAQATEHGLRGLRPGPGLLEAAGRPRRGRGLRRGAQGARATSSWSRASAACGWAR